MQDVEDEPLFCERVAGLDIAKAEVEVTIRVPSDTTAGRRQQETRTFGTTRRELESLGDWLACWGVTKIGMEATPVIRGFLERQRCLRRSDRRGRVRHRSSDDEASTHLGAVSECTWETARLGATRCPWPARHGHRLRRGPAPDNPSATEQESVISARHPLWRTALWRPRITHDMTEKGRREADRLAARAGWLREYLG